MSAVEQRTFDPVGLEVLRTRLEAITEDAADTIERTAISPIVTEAKDYSATLLDADGNLIAGGGRIGYHFGAAVHAVKSTIAWHGGTIADGDVFLGNDPHNGGGLHAQDVMVQRPIFVHGRHVAWIANSAHMIDMGGSVIGSWDPAAHECYQEAVRFPPVRLFRRGVEERDIWAVLLNNIRLSALIEMDMRGLVAGCHTGEQKLVPIVEEMGVVAFQDGVAALCALTERELRRRIGTIADGIYRWETWTDWETELYHVPCTLRVHGDELHFDFTGAPPQCTHFINSKPFIVKSELVTEIANLLAHDLPFCQGVFEPVHVHCPEGSILNSAPPAPVASGHLNAALNALTAGTQCLMLALAASPAAHGRQYLSGPVAGSVMAGSTWSAVGPDGRPEGWYMTEGAVSSVAGGHDRDGIDLTGVVLGARHIMDYADIEILEKWFPILVSERCLRHGATGAGRYRSGAGCQMSFQPHGTDVLNGVMLAMHEQLPLPGFAGGWPGATAEFNVYRPDGTAARVPGLTARFPVTPGEVFELRSGSAGGFGDPLDRPRSAVLRDVELDRLSAREASDTYGVAIDGGVVDDERTTSRRAELLTQRLARASPPLHAVDANDVVDSAGESPADLPLHPGVLQRGRLAVSERSGAVLAVAPAHWTDGCAVLEEHAQIAELPFVVRAYLDPRTGHSLWVEVAPEGHGRTFSVEPRRWTET